MLAGVGAPHSSLVTVTGSNRRVGKHQRADSKRRQHSPTFRVVDHFLMHQFASFGATDFEGQAWIRVLDCNSALVDPLQGSALKGLILFDTIWHAPE